MATQTHYDTLCVAPTATPEEIKKSWRRLIRSFHPDTAGDAGIVMTQKLNAAYTAVGTPDYRRAYDRELLAGGEPVGEPTAAPNPAPTTTQPTGAVPQAPTAPAAPSSAWDPVRYRGLQKAVLISWAAIGIGIVVSAATLDRTHSSVWLFPIVTAAIMTAARQKLAAWRAVILAVAILAMPLGAIGIWGFSIWLSDAGPVPMIAQALLAVAAFVAHSLAAPMRALHAAKPRK